MAALVYSPSEVKAKVANGTQVYFKEETNYPFDETVKFTFSAGKNTKPITFPFHLRVPAWCKTATITVNGITLQQAGGNQIVKISSEWRSGDVLELSLPRHLFKNT